jgi:hypothetical protein
LFPLQPNPKQKEIVHEQAVVPDRRRRLALSLGAALTLASAKTAQQEKMSTCNAQAAGKKGDERKAFMKGCLSASSPPPRPPSRKMKVCNKELPARRATSARPSRATA